MCFSVYQNAFIFAQKLSTKCSSIIEGSSNSDYQIMMFKGSYQAPEWKDLFFLQNLASSIIVFLDSAKLMGGGSLNLYLTINTYKAVSP